MPGRKASRDPCRCQGNDREGGVSQWVAWINCHRFTATALKTPTERSNNAEGLETIQQWSTPSSEDKRCKESWEEKDCKQETCNKCAGLKVAPDNGHSSHNQEGISCNNSQPIISWSLSCVPLTPVPKMFGLLSWAYSCYFTLLQALHVSISEDSKKLQHLDLFWEATTFPLSPGGMEPVQEICNHNTRVAFSDHWWSSFHSRDDGNLHHVRLQVRNSTMEKSQPSGFIGRSFSKA